MFGVVFAGDKHGRPQGDREGELERYTRKREQHDQHRNGCNVKRGSLHYSGIEDIGEMIR